MSIKTIGGYTTDDMRITKQEIENEVVEVHSVRSSYSVKSVGGLILGGSISAFGAYSLIKAYNNGISDLNTYLILVGFLAVLIVIDAIKRNALAKYLNSIIREIVFLYSPNLAYKRIVIGTFVFMMIFDSIGVYTTSKYVSEQNIKAKVSSSLELSALKSSASASKQNADLYRTELNSWNDSKKDAFQGCMDRWKGWKSKYKAGCKNEWLSNNPKPHATSVTSVSTSDIRNIANSKTSFFDKALFPVLFVMFLALAVIMQYLTVVEQFDKFQESKEKLTEDEVEELNEIVSDKMNIIEEHNRQVEEIITTAKAEAMQLDRDLKEATESITLEKKRKRVEKEQVKAYNVRNNISSVNNKSYTQPTRPKIAVRSKPAFYGEKEPEVSEKVEKKEQVIKRKDEKALDEDVKILAKAMLYGVEKGGKINSREALRTQGFKFNNEKLQNARASLIKNNSITKVGNSYIRV